MLLVYCVVVSSWGGVKMMFVWHLVGHPTSKNCSETITPETFN